MKLETAALLDRVRAEREAAGLCADGIAFNTPAAKADYLLRKANAEKSGRYANLPKVGA